MFRPKESRYIHRRVPNNILTRLIFDPLATKTIVDITVHSRA